MTDAEFEKKLEAFLNDEKDNDEKSLECFSKEWISTTTKEDLKDWLERSRIDGARWGFEQGKAAISKEVAFILYKCTQKLRLYRDAHNGEYVGGMEYMMLQNRIEQLIQKEEQSDQQGGGDE